MSVPTDPAPSSPFLAFVAPQDRSPMRMGLWLALGVPLAVFAIAFVGAAAQALDPGLLDRIQAHGPFTGPHRLLAESRLLGFDAFSSLAAALAVLWAARLAFQRPAWTFVSPARPFDLRLAGLGALVYAVLLAVMVGVDLLNGEKLSPPVLDAAQPTLERLVYGVAVVPLVLMAAAAEEILFRGVMLQAAGAFLKRKVGLCAVSGTIYALMNLDPSPVGFLAYAVLGAAFAYTVLELGGFEFSLGAQFANAGLTQLFVEPPSASHSAPFHWTDLAKPEAWTNLGVSLAVGLALVLAVRLIRRYRRA